MSFSEGSKGFSGRNEWEMKLRTSASMEDERKKGLSQIDEENG